MKKVMSILVPLIFIGVLLLCINGEPGAASGDVSDKRFTRKELSAESMETHKELKKQGIRAFGGYVSSKYNIAVVMVHPEDAGKLHLTQDDVPDKRYYRLIRWNEEIPVYIEFELPPTHPVGMD